MRVPLGAVAVGVLVVAVGAVGLVRAAVPLSSESASGTTSGQPIVVSGAYVRAPVPPTQIAAAYFTVQNTTGSPDTLQSVSTGAGASAVLHLIGAGGGMNAVSDVVIPAHGRLVLSTGNGHVMIEQLFGRLAAGQTVNIELDFARAGPIEVVAPVIAVGTPAPTDPSVASSGAHS